MSKTRDLWWGYVRRIMMEYPNCKPFENDAVTAAITKTSMMESGVDRLKVIGMVFFEKTHTLSGAALSIPCGYETAKRWQQDFIREVARNFSCEKLKE